MTHPCQVCATPLAFHGFKQANGGYLWYCYAHRPEDYAMPEQQPSGQMNLDLGVKVDAKANFLRFVKGNNNWASCYKAYIKSVDPGVEAMAEDWRRQAEKWIGPPSNPNVVGNAVDDLKNEGWIEYVRHAPPRDPKSHGSQKQVWRRTNKV